MTKEYEQRLLHYIKFESVYLELPPKQRRKSEDEQRSMEGKLLWEKIPKDARLILLDERGKSLSSRDLAKFMQVEMNRGLKNTVFCIGGAYGFSEEVYRRADQKISLSPMTFTHQMVRLFFTEQIYRAFTILRGEKYHHWLVRRVLLPFPGWSNDFIQVSLRLPD